MPDILTNLDHQWTEFALSPSGQRTLLRWQTAEPALRPLSSLHAMTAAARNMAGDDLDHRDEYHLALLRLAATDENARWALLHLLRPALSGIARLYSDTWDHDEACSLVVSAALDRIVRYPHGLRRPAAVIVRWVRRAMGKEAKRHCARHRALGPIGVLDEATALPAVPSPSAADELLDLVGQAVRAGALDPPRARLVILHRILSVPTSDVAEEEGYPASTIRQRRSRAEAAMAIVANGRVA